MYDECALSRVDEVYARLQSGPGGLTMEEVAARLQNYGPNKLPSAKKRSLTSRMILQIRNAFNLLLLFASALSFFSGYTYGDPGSVQMGAAILAVVIINVVFSIFQETRAEQAVQTITKLIPTKAKVFRANVEVAIEVSDVVPGDIIVLDEGDKVPADLRLVSAFEVAKLVAPTDRIGRWSVLGDPTDGAFQVFAGKGDFNAAIALAETLRMNLIPFDSTRRMMTVIHGASIGVMKAYTKGSCYDVLARCTSIFYDGGNEHLTETMIAEINRMITSFASDGYRVLAMASKELPQGMATYEEAEKEMTFLGLAALHDPPRPKTEAAVLHAKSVGVKVIMITGDHELTAEAVARKVGIISDSNHAAVTGSELNRMSDEELSRVLDTREVVFARTTPEHKLRVVKALMAKGEIVAVTGDGVNDSPALIEANVGIAMGAGGTDVARVCRHSSLRQ
jgi:magnesium-transporting ATPase (P-type)